ncbi:MAG: histidine--tRNA ligase [Candidatus Micrarchaeota archaeon]|nr:histidine--tRNA ligase [Candidatus Micrarchaeota archaeon]
MDYSAPKGMRDFLPQEMERRERAIGIIREVYRRFGFVPMDTPALERVEVLEKKCGEEIKGQLFRIDDGRLALRFDLTVPLARVVANSSFPKPFKRYCIGLVWRREEPQRGRFREFLQADADIIGSQSKRCEAELIAAACEAIERLGVSDFEVLLNNRKILDGLVERLGLKDRQANVLRALDKLEKIGKAGVKEELKGAGLPSQQIDSLFSALESPGKNEERLSSLAKYSKEGAEELKEVLSLLREYQIGKARVEPSLVRGLDYYTGPIFEVRIKGFSGSIAAGGRYDGLLGLYGQPDFAVGISIGVERLLSLTEGEKGQKQRSVFVANAKEEDYPYALLVAGKLRAAGVPAQTDLNARSLKKQMEYAASACKWIAIVGEKEKKEEKITLRDLESGKEEMLPLEEAIRRIKTSA